MTVAIETIEELLAHSLVLEAEAAERYEDIADNLEVHNNLETAPLFRKLAGYAHKHADEMKELAKEMDIPHIAPWDLKWTGNESPEAIPDEDVHYLMNPHQALTLALTIEKGAQQFYASVAENSKNADVIELATEFAEEEAGHVALLEGWIKDLPEPDKNWDYDPDPPFMPE